MTRETESPTVAITPPEVDTSGDGPVGSHGRRAAPRRPVVTP